MKNGDISNIVSPFIAFDMECIVFVPLKNRLLVSFLEMFGLHSRAMQYYQLVPQGKKVLDMLMRVGYNIMFVYIGPRRYWKAKMFILNYFAIPFTTLNCVASQSEFNSTIIRADEVLQYTGLSQFAVHAAGKKGRLFESWDMFLMAQSGIRPGAWEEQVFSKGG
jgi:hypothetical protein